MMLAKPDQGCQNDLYRTHSFSEPNYSGFQYFCLFESYDYTEKVRDRDIQSADSFTKWPQWSDLGQIEAWSLELHLSLTHGCKGRISGPFCAAFPCTLGGNQIKSNITDTQQLYSVMLALPVVALPVIPSHWPQNKVFQSYITWGQSLTFMVFF